MQTVNVIRGRVTGPTSVELEEALPPGTRDVEVWLRVGSPVAAESEQDVFSFLRGLPAGLRDRADIDSQIRSDREEWGER